MAEGVKTRRFWTWKKILLLIGVYIVLKICGVFQFYGPYWGRVTDVDTGEPLAGAGVLAVYYEECSGPGGHGQGPFVGVREAFTDENGNFFMRPRIFLMPPNPFCQQRWDPDKVYALVPGYVVGELESATSLDRMGFHLKKLGNDLGQWEQTASSIENSIGWVSTKSIKGGAMSFKDNTFLAKKYVELAKTQRDIALSVSFELEKEQKERKYAQ